MPRHLINLQLLHIDAVHRGYETQGGQTSESEKKLIKSWNDGKQEGN